MMVNLIKLFELQVMTKALTGITGKSYTLNLRQDELDKWFIELIADLGEPESSSIQTFILQQSKSNKPKTFRLLEDCMRFALDNCSNLGGLGELNLHINGMRFSLKKDDS